MTNRVRTLTVMLEHEWREDDVQQILNAIRMIRGVADVVPTKVGEQMAVWGAKVELKREILEKVVELLK
jgi:hypothetical protein